MRANELLGSKAGGTAGVSVMARYGAVAAFKNMQQLIQLRWIAVLGQLVTIVVVEYGYDIRLPLVSMVLALGGLVTFNLISSWRWRKPCRVTHLELFVALLFDVAALTAQLYFTGGATNPFAFLYLLQVILAVVLLQTWLIWVLVVITSLCLSGLTVFSQPLILPPEQGLALFSLYIQGMLICFVLNAALLVVFTSRINRNLREYDERLADWRQRAVEEEHIVRMGLMASGAAHELGTPLATLLVILGDWRRMPTFTNNDELRQELDEMQVQVQRCKSIVRGILLSVGEARGEAPVVTTIGDFFDELVSEWSVTRNAGEMLHYQNYFTEDASVVSDVALKQMVGNLLDNAFEVSPQWVSLQVTRNGDDLMLMVADQGPGFTPTILKNFGKPYQSTKGRLGGGLGLFLSSNVARTLGGRVVARNRAEGGAVVTVSLPLAAISLVDEK